MISHVLFLFDFFFSLNVPIISWFRYLVLSQHAAFKKIRKLFLFSPVFPYVFWKNAAKMSLAVNPLLSSSKELLWVAFVGWSVGPSVVRQKCGKNKDAWTGAYCAPALVSNLTWKVSFQCTNEWKNWNCKRVWIFLRKVRTNITWNNNKIVLWYPVPWSITICLVLILCFLPDRFSRTYKDHKADSRPDGPMSPLLTPVGASWTTSANLSAFIRSGQHWLVLDDFKEQQEWPYLRPICSNCVFHYIKIIPNITLQF